MKEKDIIAKDFFRDNERFADIFNVGMFKGEKLLRSEQLGDEEGYTGAVVKKHSKKIPVEKYRDVVKKAAYGGNFALLGLENQADIHYAMPVRVMGYDYLRYEEQLREIGRKHKKNKDLEGAEYISKFAAKDKVKPVCTLVLYYGKDPWIGPKSLSEMTDWDKIPEQIRRIVPDYPLYVLDVRRFQDVEKLKTDVKLVFGFLQREEDREWLKEYVEENQEAFSQMEEDTYDMISAFTKTKVFMERKEEFKSEDGGMNMCEAIRQMIEEGKEEGKKEGMKKARRKGIKILIEACKELGVSEADTRLKLEEKYSLTKKEVDFLIRKFWRIVS